MPAIVPIIISTNDYRKLKRIAKVLKPYLTEENLFVISSDFSHYPTYEDAYKVDARTGKAVESGDVEEFIRVLEENANSHVKNLDRKSTRLNSSHNVASRMPSSA